MTNIEKALASKKRINFALKLLKKYYDYLNIFSWKNADKLPEHQSYNHKIILKLDKQSIFDLLYKISLNKLKCLKKYLNKHLFKEFIHISFSSAITSILFAKKSRDDLYFCVNYQALNEIIIKNYYLIFLIQETLNYLSKTHYYMKLNIIIIFNYLRIAKDDK